MPFGRVRHPTLVLTTSLILAASTATAASSSTPSRDASRGAVAAPTIESVREQVKALDGQIRAATLALGRAKAEVAAQDKAVQGLRIEVAAAVARRDSARSAAGKLAAESYRKGSLDPDLWQVVLADHPDAVLTHASMVGRLNHRQAVVVERTREASAALQDKQARLARQLRALQAAQAQAETTSRRLADQRAAAATLLRSLEEEERRRLEAERKAAADRQAALERRAIAARGVPAVSRGGARAVSSGSCPASGRRGAERALSPTALRVMRCGLAAFPRIDRALGWGTRGGATDHDDGRAVDFMIPRYGTGPGNDLGWAVAEWAARQPSVTYVIFDQRIYLRGSGTWRPMGNRGSDTANHRDHVHVSVG